MFTQKIKEKEREREEREKEGSRETRELGTDRQPHITTQQKRKSFVDLLGFNKEENIFIVNIQCIWDITFSIIASKKIF